MHKSYSSQNGNVLFLILIAVALFAALSYAVTSSTRSGSGDVSKEKLNLQYSRMQTYVSGLRNTIVRMKMAGTDITEINFYAPSQFGTLSAAQLAANVFSPKGGNYPYDDFDDSASGFLGVQYTFILQIENIGTTTTDSSGNEIVIAIGVSDQMCNLINQKFGYTGAIPSGGGFIDDWTGPLSLSENGTDYRQLVTDFSLPAAFVGKVEACALDAPSGENHYYAALAER